MTLTGLPAASAAAPSPSPGAASQLSAGTATAAARPAIKCLLRVHLPHYSHHSDAQDKHRVNVTADVKCNRKVAALKIKVRLYKNGRVYKTTGWRSNVAKSKIAHNAARRCVKNQKYQGEAWAVVKFPPGYRPPVLNGHVKSRVVVIRKCKRS
ncbi:hypothetical protein ETD83_04940 [Actinomadura soli]|uniref:Uncharacterized protein n=2 Tax=Actinomadura soli TaxID=2508997 RepID=A0A5C4JI26_9ACTN|nr:hypothetical protein ETD83_04940 [Actinomadura soli]